MQKRIIRPSGASGAGLPFSPAVAFGSLLFVSGQIGRDESGVLADGLVPQVHQTMKNIQSILEVAGASLDTVLKVTVYLANFDDFKEFNQTYQTYFDGDYPARTTFQVGRLGPGVLIEIDAIAYLPTTA